MYFITTKRMLEVCFFQHTPTFIIEPFLDSTFHRLEGKNPISEADLEWIFARNYEGTE